MKKNRFYQVVASTRPVTGPLAYSDSNICSEQLRSDNSCSSRPINPLSHAERKKREAGAALVELAIALPVLLLLLFCVMYVSHLMSARAALSTAVNSVRIAATRANLPKSPQLVEDIKFFNEDKLHPLLASSGLEQEAFSDGINGYKQFYQSQYGKSKELSDFEIEEILSMVYAINIVRQSLGKQVRTPCKDSGCLLCLPVPAPWADDPNGLTNTITTPPPGARFAGIYCEYRPDLNIINVINSFIRFINPTSQGFSTPVIRRQRSMVFNN